MTSKLSMLLFLRDGRENWRIISKHHLKWMRRENLVSISSHHGLNSPPTPSAVSVSPVQQERNVDKETWRKPWSLRLPPLPVWSKNSNLAIPQSLRLRHHPS